MRWIKKEGKVGRKGEVINLGSILGSKAGTKVNSFPCAILMRRLGSLFQLGSLFLFLLLSSCVMKKEKEKIDFRTYLAEQQKRRYDLVEEGIRNPEILEKMYYAFLKTGKMPYIYMETLTTTIIISENNLVKPQHIKKVEADGMIIPQKIDGIEIDVRPGDAFMGTALASALSLPEGMTLAIPIPENGKIPIFRAVEKVEKLPDGTQKVYTRQATFPDVFKVLIIKNGDAVLTGLKDELGVGDLIPDPDLYAPPTEETPEEKKARKIAEFLWEQGKEQIIKKLEDEIEHEEEKIKEKGGDPEKLKDSYAKMIYMGLVEFLKEQWPTLPP